MAVRSGPRSQGRQTSPPHRLVQGMTSDGNYKDPVRCDRGRITLIYEAPLETSRGGELRIKLGHGLKVEGGELVLDLAQTIPQAALTKLSEDGVSASTPTAAEVQAAMDKIDETIQALRDGLYKEA